MKFCVISSGSKGNMTYIETPKARILLDVGISLKEAKKRTINHEINFENIDAILITHEHGDHINFLPTLIKLSKATLYINKLSFDNLSPNIKSKLDNVNIRFIEENKKYRINDLEFLTLKLSHDSANIFGFIFITNDKRLAYITDTGFFPVHYLNILKNVDGLIIEANHDITMLMECDRSLYLKKRILSPQGHMSNYICQQILLKVLNERHKVVVLAHLSEECNTIEIVERDIIQEIKQIYNGEVIVAKQYEALAFFQL